MFTFTQTKRVAILERPAKNGVSFNLSIDEATRYFATHEARVTKATEYAISRGAWTWTKKDQLAGSCFWWLRSSGYSQKDAATVFYDGYVDGSGHRVDDDDKYAVRPAMLERPAKNGVSFNKLNKKCKRTIDTLGINEYNVEKISNYAKMSYFSCRYDEVEAEYMALRKMKGEKLW